MSQRYPTPPVFFIKSPQAIENKRGERRKECKERKRVRKSLRTQDLPGRRRTPRGRNGLKCCEGEVQAGGKITSERWRVHCLLALGSRTRLEILSRFASGRLKVGRAGEPQRLGATSTRIHRQDTAWGTSGQLVGRTVWVQVAGFFPRKIRCFVLTANKFKIRTHDTVQEVDCFYYR